ncbi:MAG: hypothetical protein HOP10_00455 [Chitinophagaceae bacterium]|nr:hypothetical protein [Chitinophagaceae bacterium]
MKKTITVALLMIVSGALFAQEKEKDEKEERTFKENLFTGGSVTVGFSNNTFIIGGSPVLGYSLTNWADAGLVFNYTYTSYRDVYVYDDRLRQKVYGGGAFVRLYPVRFLFAQAQVEHNFIRQKYIPDPTSGAGNSTAKGDVSSFLVGGGYTSGRWGRGGGPFYYLSVMFDIAKGLNSPYTDAYGRIIPIVRGGFQIPLFQGSGGR